MTKKMLLGGLVVLVVAFAAAMPANAAAQAFYMSVVTPQEGNQYVRYYQTGNDKVNPNCQFACSTPNVCEAPYCRQVQYNATAGGYRGYLEDIANYDGVAGTNYLAVWDTEKGTGGSHAGYYLFGGGPVSPGQTSAAFATGCTGTAAGTCLAQGNATNANGTAIPQTPLGTLNPVGGLRPIPVPKVSGVDTVGGGMTLSWEAATGLNGAAGATIAYDVVGLAKTTCTPPAGDEFVGAPRRVSGLTTTFNVADFGNTPATPACYYFALKLVYPNAGATPVVSRFFSANSQGVAFGGLSGSVVNIQARMAGRSGVAVTWNTSLEDGLQGFHVLRSFTIDGKYEAVSSLIPAKGEPSSYSYMDTALPQGKVGGTGVYYQIQTVDSSEQTALFGPVKADLGGAPTTVKPPAKRTR